MQSIVPQLKMIIVVQDAVYEEKSRDIVCYTSCMMLVQSRALHRAKSTTVCIMSALHHYVLAVSTQTGKPPNLIPRHFQLYGRQQVHDISQQIVHPCTLNKDMQTAYHVWAQKRDINELFSQQLQQQETDKDNFRTIYSWTQKLHFLIIIRWATMQAAKSHVHSRH